MIVFNYLIMFIFIMIQSHIVFPSVLTQYKNILVQVIIIFISSVFIRLQLEGLALPIYLLLLFIYLGFYNDESLKLKVNYFLGNSIVYILCILVSLLIKDITYETVIVCFNTLSYLYFIWLFHHDEKLLCLFIILISILILTMTLNSENQLLLVILHFVVLVVIEYIFEKNKIQYDVSTKKFQTNIMVHHYDEVKTVYLNMRGWRHDYHNHLQSLKAYLSKDQIKEAQRYLNELEKDLDRVDTLVKSGNVMVDAILNSKLTIAQTKNIKIIESVIAPEHVTISDVDLCIILANIFDNAIEACEQIEEDKRFIRVYINVLQNQLYISLVNSAQEELTDHQKNYISEKRGNHGHGMKRVKLSVEKYDGYLNLKNEPGVFACEIMLPLVHEN